MQELFGTTNDGTDNLAWDKALVATDGAAEQYVVGGADTEEVVKVHDNGVDGDTLPDAEVARFFPIKIGERGFGSGAVGVHDVAIVGVAAENVGNDFAESLRIEAFVYVLDGIVDVLFGC